MSSPRRRRARSLLDIGDPGCGGQVPGQPGAVLSGRVAIRRPCLRLALRRRPQKACLRAGLTRLSPGCQEMRKLPGSPACRAGRLLRPGAGHRPVLLRVAVPLPGGVPLPGEEPSAPLAAASAQSRPAPRRPGPGQRTSCRWRWSARCPAWSCPSPPRWSLLSPPGRALLRLLPPPARARLRRIQASPARIAPIWPSSARIRPVWPRPARGRPGWMRAGCSVPG